MSCTHHPKYDPASGEPTGTWNIVAKLEGTGGSTLEDNQLRLESKSNAPCPFCWQAYAKYMYSCWKNACKNWDHSKERIKELEADGERLNWLDEQISWDKEPGIWWHFEWPSDNKLTLRQAIDKARKEQA